MSTQKANGSNIREVLGNDVWNVITVITLFLIAVLGHRVLDGPPPHDPSPAINVSAILPPPLSVSPTP